MEQVTWLGSKGGDEGEGEEEEGKKVLESRLEMK
jgi:hypothetical protein